MHLVAIFERDTGIEIVFMRLSQFCFFIILLWLEVPIVL
jgi:hypothetical protein